MFRRLRDRSLRLRGRGSTLVPTPSKFKLAKNGAEADLTLSYRNALGRAPDEDGRRAYLPQLRDGRTVPELVLELTTSREGLVRASRQAGMYVDERSDDTFVEDLYRDLLGRPADRDGRAWLTGLLRAGVARDTVALTLASSDEYLNAKLASLTHIQDLREIRSDAFHMVEDSSGKQVEVFRAGSQADVDWMESAILEYGYYEKPGIWSLALDGDKRRMARLLSAFRPDRAMDIGCSSGAVIEALDDLGVDCCLGLEISRMAIQRASPRIRSRIVKADLLTADVQGPFDLIFGLDIFEHLNPYRLKAYLARVRELLSPEGFLFVNSPAFGHDEVYGTVFPQALPSWVEDDEADRAFHEWPVDASGYPHHGHLVWASPRWWTRTFLQAGFHRQEAVERGIHDVFDGAFEEDSIARKAFFVFSQAPASSRSSQVLATLAASEGHGNLEAPGSRLDS